MGLPVLDTRVLTLDGALLVGCTWMDGSRYHPFIYKDLLYRCENSKSVYPMVVFDTWVCNTDRNEGNLIVRCHGLDKAGPRAKDCGANRHTLLLKDHSDCLLPDNRETTFFDSCLAKMRPPECVPLQFVRSAIINLDLLRAALSDAEAISDDTIRDIVEGVPDELLPCDDKPAWTKFLSSRRDALRELFNKDRGIFRFLRDGEL